MSRLEHLQREFFAAMKFPLRSRSREVTELPPSDEPHDARFLEIAEAIIKPAPRLSSAERLELYHRQYWYRLLDSIEEDFPVLARMLGRERFWELMEDYLLACPSRSFTLRHLGERLPGFILEWGKADGRERRWFHGIARLEYARMEVYERGECRPVLPEELAVSVLCLQPHVVRIDLPVPADLCDGWESFPSAATLPESEPDEPVRLAVWRTPRGGSDEARLEVAEAVLLDRLAEGGTLEEVFREPVDPPPSPEDVSAWFGAWHARGWIAVRPEGGEAVPFVRELEAAGDIGGGVDKMSSQSRAL